jgi:hypothetical protein
VRANGRKTPKNASDLRLCAQHGRSTCAAGEINRKAEQLQIDDISLDNPFRQISIHALWLA